MREIDEMDMIGFLKIRAWEAREAKKASEPKRKFIDEVWKMEANA